MAAKIHVAFKTTGGYLIVPCAAARTMRISPTFSLPVEFDKLPHESKCQQCAQILEKKRAAKKAGK